MKRTPASKSFVREVVNCISIYFTTRSKFYDLPFSGIPRKTRFFKYFVRLVSLLHKLKAEPEDYIFGQFFIHSIVLEGFLYPPSLVSPLAIRRYEKWERYKSIKRHYKKTNKDYYVKKLQRGLGISVERASEIIDKEF